MCILNEEPDLEIEGVWCFRDSEIPAEITKFEQFQYYNVRRLDIDDKNSIDLLTQFLNS